MSHCIAVTRLVSIIMRDDDTNNVSASVQIFVDGPVGRAFSLIGEGFFFNFEMFLSAIAGVGVKTLEASMVPRLARLLSRRYPLVVERLGQIDYGHGVICESVRIRLDGY